MREHTSPLTIVGLGGSLREHSTSLAALNVAMEAAGEDDVAKHVLDVRSLDLPMYDPEAEAPPAAGKTADIVDGADGMLWSSPLYDGTISRSFKNALDWLEFLGRRELAYLSGKVIGLISTAGGVQGLQAINTMEFIVRALRGWAVPLVLPIARAWQVFAPGPDVLKQLHALGREVARASAQMRRDGICDYAEMLPGPPAPA